MSMPVRTIEITPRPSALVGSLRGLGYSPETALADLIDNSITAQAARIDIDIQWNGGTPTVAVFDDGKGMSEAQLQNALRLGGEGAEYERSVSDLGRFGLGLKTASLSQCRRLTVVTKHADSICALTLDVHVIMASGWLALVPDQLPEHPFTARLQEQVNGTIIFWNEIDEVSGLSGLSKEAFYLRLEDIRAHLGMIFHRFIDGDARKLAIHLNGRRVKAWDPFQTAHPSTRPMPSQPVRHAGAVFTVQPYVLPHRDRFENDTEYNAAGGPGGWSARQGFYVYRGKRLLVPGSWLGLGGFRTWTRNEASRLARIKVDLPTGLDKDWRIDVRKSQARPPGAVRDRLTAIAARCREEAREVFAFRGAGPRHRGAPHAAPAVWIASSGQQGIRYRINRDHPLIVACRGSAESLRALNAVLSIIERTVPVERIWLDVSESEGAAVPVLGDEEVTQLADQLAALGRTLPARMSLEQRIDALLLNLPGDLTRLRLELSTRLGASHG